MIAAHLAVCSWSLLPPSPDFLATSLRRCGLTRLQLALAPLLDDAPWQHWAAQRTHATNAAALADPLHHITLVSGMFAPLGEDYRTLDTIRLTGGLRSDALWPANRERAFQCAAIAQALGVSLVTFHAGFMPHDTTLAADRALRTSMLDRITDLAAIFFARNVRLALETGQESASTLLAVLQDLAGRALPAPDDVGVNFDPANIILYGMGDPSTALRQLAAWVRQVHIKDALPAAHPGQWGTETVVGQGSVDWPAFFAALHEAVPDASVNLVIEREAGTNRIADVRSAVEFCAQFTGA